MKRSIGWGGLVLIGILGLTAEGRAQRKQRVVTISEITIVGRVQKPIAAVDVSRIQPKLTLSTKKQPFVDRIEKALEEPPF
jgi:hypothetical protein